jgi:murein DD-endopeptidase MepM/ murein hydrolase activator NlpD
MKKRIACFLLALSMLAGVVCMASPATVYAETTAEKLEVAKQKLAELQAELDAVRANKQDILEQKYVLDKRNTALMEEIDLLNAQISETTNRIAQNEEREKEQYDLFCRQVRKEEERGVTSYWSVLFKATGFADLLSRLDFVNEVMDYDQKVIDDLRATRQKLKEDRAALEEQKAELEEAKAELEKQIAEADALLEEYAKQEGAIQKMHDAEEAAAAQLEKEIKEAEERRRREEEERRQREEDNTPSPVDVPGTSGGYIWPSNDSMYVTSPIGARVAPGGIGSTNHQGIDIGAAYGTNILASKSGVVLLACWYGGYGNCVIIQHGYGGYYTTYGHMSRILVYEGQEVDQGQVIGLVGSTGNSTGPHIHFEIHEAGVVKNPLDYFTGWIAAW